jgi:membrane protease YdiL (CAAX protease family)
LQQRPFSLLHTQYTDPRTFFLLFLVSLVLTAARVKTKGLGLPVALHMIMNGSVSVLSYLFITVSGR